MFTRPDPCSVDFFFSAELPNGDLNIAADLQSFLGNPLTIYRGLLGPAGPKPRKSRKKVSRGLWLRGPPRVWKKVSKKSRESGKSLERSRKDFFETFSRLSGGDFFQTFSGFRARRAQETPVNGQRVPKSFLLFLLLF